MYISAKSGLGVDKVFESIIDRIPPPAAPEKDVVLNEDGTEVKVEEGKEAKVEDPLKCFLFDAKFVPERGGVACLIKVMSGVLNHDNCRQLMSYHLRKRYEIY